MASVSGVATGGTIGYMPPEQMEREELDERCDQWALASLTYEMLARGENPFRAASIDEALDKIYDAEIVIPSLLMEGIGEDLDDAIFRALDPDKEGRYPSVHSFARDAKPALGNPKQGVKKLGAIVSEAIGANTDDALSRKISTKKNARLKAKKSRQPTRLMGAGLVTRKNRPRARRRSSRAQHQRSLPQQTIHTTKDSAKAPLSKVVIRSCCASWRSWGACLSARSPFLISACCPGGNHLHCGARF